MRPDRQDGHPRPHRSAPVVVGVEGSTGGRQALAWALLEAVTRGTAVRVVTVWSWTGLVLSPYTATSRAQVAEQTADIQEAALADGLAELAAAGTTAPPIERVVVEGDAATVLVEHASDACMLVVGAYGHGRLHRTLLGSVAEMCSRHAGCPVVVVPVHDQMLLSAGDAARTHGRTLAGA